jgi:UDP-N-acetylglucosamine 1-carboxyvinyltransferase
VPDLADVGLLKRILANHGVDYMVSGKRATDPAHAGETLTLSAETIVDTTAPYELVSRMRASFWVMTSSFKAWKRSAQISSSRAVMCWRGRPAALGEGACGSRMSPWARPIPS